MTYNYRKLEGKITEHFGTKAAFADAIGMNRATLTQKLHSRVAFTQHEIDKACAALEINVQEIPIYFFAKEDVISQHMDVV